jgi:hypothetical protein
MLATLLSFRDREGVQQGLRKELKTAAHYFLLAFKWLVEVHKQATRRDGCPTSSTIIFNQQATFRQQVVTSQSTKYGPPNIPPNRLIVLLCPDPVKVLK